MINQEVRVVDTKKYGVILADPPWQFRKWSGKTNAHNSTAEDHYPTMALEEIANLPVGELTLNNSALFLWAVWPEMPGALRVMEAWGYKYKTIAWVWAKLNRSSVGFYFGMGSYTRANSEPCLLGIKGSMPPEARDVQALIVTPIRGHSRKPDEQYGKIERLYPSVPKLELFSRHKRTGWDVWGNEVSSDIVLEHGL